jgi:aspartyl-tRNA(Asn)/glutamyl-tRNA(Gln) amidotransferase subunit A
MIATPLHQLSITEAGRQLRAGEITSRRLTEASLQRITALDPQIRAFVTLTADRAMADAQRADEAFSRGQDHGPMQGIPYALKDLIDTAGIRTTAGSRLRHAHVPTEDAAVAARLREAGGVLLGKLATYEFAVVGPSFDLPFPPARNPWNTDHITGGSSSGSAAAVAGGFVRTVIGTDTGGSIRSPACYCGVVGLKPTYGRVSLNGVYPLAPSLDHAGPLSATVEEAALTLDVIVSDEAPRSRPRMGQDLRGQDLRGQDLRGLTIAFPRSFHIFDPEAAPEVITALDDAVSQLSLLGARIEEIDLPNYQLFEDCGAVILQAEAYAVHAHNLRARAQDYGRLAYQSLAAGFVLTSADVARAREVQRALTLALNRDVFSRYDAMVCANALTPALRFDSFDGKSPRWTAMRTLPFNVTGHPALALPIGRSRNGLPMGMQIIGKAFDEAGICAIGAAYESATDWARLPDPIGWPGQTTA